MKRLALAAALALAGCANTQYGGLNYATVISPTGEEWRVISGKDQTNTKLTIVRGDVTVTYSSDKEDATAALTQALKTQSDMLQLLVDKVTSLATPIP